MMAIIPARGGSKGVHRKNLRTLYGRPLIAWSIERALECSYINRVIVSTDDQEIAEVAAKFGAEVPGLRPSILSADESSTESVMIHALSAWCPNRTPDAVVLLQPTSPLRLPNSLSEAISHFREKGADSLVSVCPNHAFFWKDLGNPTAMYSYLNRPRRQDILVDQHLYKENGSIYITKTAILERFKNRLGGKIAMYLMQEIESYEIDSEIDLVLHEALFSYAYSEVEKKKYEDR